jgi:hypothetical protein
LAKKNHRAKPSQGLVITKSCAYAIILPPFHAPKGAFKWIQDEDSGSMKFPGKKSGEENIVDKGAAQTGEELCYNS